MSSHIQDDEERSRNIQKHNSATPRPEKSESLPRASCGKPDLKLGYLQALDTYDPKENARSCRSKTHKKKEQRAETGTVE